MQVDTRGKAKLLLNLANYADSDEDMDYYIHNLSFWIGGDEVEEISRHLQKILKERPNLVDLLVKIVGNMKDSWPAYRRLAIIDALLGVKNLIPINRMPEILWERSDALISLGRYEESLTEATMNLDLCPANNHKLQFGIHITLGDVKRTMASTSKEVQESISHLKKALTISKRYNITKFRDIAACETVGTSVKS